MEWETLETVLENSVPEPRFELATTGMKGLIFYCNTFQSIILIIAFTAEELSSDEEKGESEDERIEDQENIIGGIHHLSHQLVTI